MWKCKTCGCSKITATLYGEWSAYKKVTEKSGKVKPVTEDEMINLGGNIYDYQCDDCGAVDEDIKEIADWIED